LIGEKRSIERERERERERELAEIAATRFVEFPGDATPISCPVFVREKEQVFRETIEDSGLESLTTARGIFAQHSCVSAEGSPELYPRTIVCLAPHVHESSEMITHRGIALGR